MLDTCVPEGALFYGQNRRRKVVAFDEALRTLTKGVAKAAQSLLRSGHTPPPEYEKRKCSKCSLVQICQPHKPSHAGKRGAVAVTDHRGLAPVRRHLNTLYVTTPDAWLHKDGENVVVKVDGKEQARVPVHILGGIVCLGALGVTPALMGHCAEQGVRISFMSRSGRFLARVEGPVSGNVLLRRSQYRLADSQEQTSLLASHLVTGKIVNQRTVVRRALRDHNTTSSADWSSRLKTCERRLSDAAPTKRQFTGHRRKLEESREKPLVPTLECFAILCAPRNRPSHSPAAPADPHWTH